MFGIQTASLHENSLLYLKKERKAAVSLSLNNHRSSLFNQRIVIICTIYVYIILMIELLTDLEPEYLN